MIYTISYDFVIFMFIYDNFLSVWRCQILDEEYLTKKENRNETNTDESHGKCVYDQSRLEHVQVSEVVQESFFFFFYFLLLKSALVNNPNN